MSKKNDKNYMDYVPVKNPDVEYETADNGRVTVFIEWKGFYHRIAQKFFHRPRGSYVMMVELCRLVLPAHRDQKDELKLSLDP